MSFGEAVPVGIQNSLPYSTGIKTALTAVSVSNIQLIAPNPLGQLNVVRWRCNLCRLQKVPNYATIDLSIEDTDGKLYWEERFRIGSDATRPTILEALTIDRKFEPSLVLEDKKGFVLVANYVDGGDNVQMSTLVDYWLAIGIKMPTSAGLSTYP